MMTIGTIAELLDAKILCAEDTEARVDSACGSDMMSDVLAYVKDQAVLLTHSADDGYGLRRFCPQQAAHGGDGRACKRAGHCSDDHKQAHV